jgi:hypothetical protein
LLLTSFDADFCPKRHPLSNDRWFQSLFLPRSHAAGVQRIQNEFMWCFSPAAQSLGFAGFLTGKVLAALRVFYIAAPSPG